MDPSSNKENVNLTQQQVSDSITMPSPAEVKAKVVGDCTNGTDSADKKSTILVSPVKKEFLECDTSTVDSGFDEEHSRDSSIITASMIQEEQLLQKKLEREQERQRRKHEKELHDEVMKKMRYKRLMNLLKRSEFYANFMQEKVTKYFEAEKKGKKTNQKTSEQQKKTTNPKTGTKRKKQDICEDFSENILSACKKLKKSDNTAEASSAQVVKGSDSESLVIGSSKPKGSGETKTQTYITPLGIEVDARQPKLLEGACLRDYQLDGLTWLKLLFESGLNGILADEMGLGKTVQVIALVCHLYESNVPGPFLIVGPLSTLPNWMIEFSRFAPQLPVVLYHGSAPERTELRRQFYKSTPLNGNKVRPVVLTSYEIPIKDEYTLRQINWKYIIVDEGHRLKNYKTQLSRTLSGFASVNRLLLTGTPLQNNLTELWSLLHFLLPDIFDSLDAFQSWFEVEDIERADVANQLVEKEKKDHILSSLHKILSPFLLRRVKSEVNLNLPPKKEVLVRCPMSKIQRKIYEAIIDRSILQIMKADESIIIPDNEDGTKAKRRSAMRKNDSSVRDIEPERLTLIEPDEDGIDQYLLNVKIANPSMALRKALNHPYLINMPVLPGSRILRVDEGLVTDCGKFTVLDGLLSRLKANGHKVIIFSTFTSLLNLLEELMIMRDYDYERLDGTNSLDVRKVSIHRFNTEKNVFAFLVSTRAGGLGINLTAADTAIIYDSDWNPQADLQAQDRCHRIGQTRPVVVYRFITEGSLDEKIYSRATAKRKLEKIIIHGGKFNNSMRAMQSKTIDLEELKELLLSKPECRELRTDGSVMTKEEWDELLDRSDLYAAMEANDAAKDAKST